MERQCRLAGEIFLRSGRKGERCLEIGCSKGDALPFLKRYFALVVGIDISMEKLLMARESLFEGCYLICTGGWEDREISYPVSSSSFDCIVFFSLLHHLRRGQTIEVLREAKRILKDGGILIVFEYNLINPVAIFKVLFEKEERGARMLTPKRVKELFYTIGLKIVEEGYLLFFPKPFSFLSSLERRMKAIPFGGKFVIAGRKE